MAVFRIRRKHLIMFTAEAIFRGSELPYQGLFTFKILSNSYFNSILFALYLLPLFCKAVQDSFISWHILFNLTWLTFKNKFCTYLNSQMNIIIKYCTIIVYN